MPILCLAGLHAQTTSSTNTNEKTQSPDANEKTKKEGHAKQLGERALDLAVVGDVTALVIEGRDTKVAPLTTAQKFGQFQKDFTNPFNFIETSFEAGIDQASGTHDGYGQGAAGYGKRYGADIADAATAEFFSIGALPSVLHIDPRYYRMGRGNIFSRATYSFSRTIVTRTDSGRHVFNASEILGSAAASGISRAYYPADERNIGDFGYNMASRIAFDGIYNLAKEFWPDARKRLFGHR